MPKIPHIFVIKCQEITLISVLPHDPEWQADDWRCIQAAATRQQWKMIKNEITATWKTDDVTKMSQIAFCCSTHPLQTLTEVIGLWGLANVCQSVWVECICSGIEHTSACQCTPRQSQRFTPTASGLHEVNIWMGGRAVGLARSSTLKCSVWPNKKQNGLEFWMRHNMWGFRTALTYFQLFIVSYS